LAPVESWLPPRALHRIARNPGPNGARALGRLALLDHYPAIAQRVRRALERAAAPEALQEAARRTGLPVRSGRPRVYVVAALGGGTGSGMFLDVAYLAQALLCEVRPGRADVIGLLSLPPAPGPGARGGRPAGADGEDDGLARV